LNILHKIIRKKLYLDPVLPYLSKIFPIVPASTKFLNEVYKVPLNLMDLLPLGADTDMGKSVKQKKEGSHIREFLNIPSTDIVIFSGGKLQKLKKTELLIEAFHKLNCTDVHLIIIGEAGEKDQDYKQSLLNIANNHPRIHFIGWLKSIEVYKYLDAADLAVFPASQSILWQQAISMGLPLIVGDTGNQSIDYLNEHENIILLGNERISTESIFIEIHIVINDRAKLNRMKIGAQKVTEKYLTWDNLILKTLQFNN
jgi:glycosyltransferase involved in cell wall biosynthesis